MAKFHDITSAVQSPKSRVAQWTTQGRWLGGPYYLWMVCIYWVRNDDKTLIICAVYSQASAEPIFFSRSCLVSKARDFYLKFSNHFVIWQAAQHKCCQAACQLSKWLEYFPPKLHTVVKWREICGKFICRKTDYSRCKYVLPVPFMGRIWWPSLDSIASQVKSYLHGIKQNL